VASDYDELAILEANVLIKFVDTELACVKVFTLQRPLKVGKRGFVW